MIGLAEARDHLCITEAEEAEAELKRFIAAAYGHIGSLDVDVTADPLPPAIDQAALILVEHFYNERNIIEGKPNPIPRSFGALIAPHRRWHL